MGLTDWFLGGRDPLPALTAFPPPLIPTGAEYCKLPHRAAGVPGRVSPCRTPVLRLNMPSDKVYA